MNLYLKRNKRFKILAKPFPINFIQLLLYKMSLPKVLMEPWGMSKILLL